MMNSICLLWERFRKCSIWTPPVTWRQLGVPCHKWVTVQAYYRTQNDFSSGVNLKTRKKNVEIEISICFYTFWKWFEVISTITTNIIGLQSPVNKQKNRFTLSNHLPCINFVFFYYFMVVLIMGGKLRVLGFIRTHTGCCCTPELCQKKMNQAIQLSMYALHCPINNNKATLVKIKLCVKTTLYLTLFNYYSILSFIKFLKAPVNTFWQLRENVNVNNLPTSVTWGRKNETVVEIITNTDLCDQNIRLKLASEFAMLHYTRKCWTR